MCQKILARNVKTKTKCSFKNNQYRYRRIIQIEVKRIAMEEVATCFINVVIDKGGGNLPGFLIFSTYYHQIKLISPHGLGPPGLQLRQSSNG